MLIRKIAQSIKNTKKSILLLGPRQTGKSTLLRSMEPDLIINLADEEVYLSFVSNPAELRLRISSLKSKSNNPLLIMIDEVQRIPSLLNTVQAIIDETSIPPKFLLSGSSARKLKRGNSNLLPGRVINFSLGPIISSEMDYQLDTNLALSFGTLPGIITEANQSEAKQVLKSYSSSYLKEEIQAEALTKDIQGFSRFLKAVTSWGSELIDYTKISSQAMISRQSVSRYFDILEDTMVYHRLPAFSKSTRVKLIQHPKLYAFDIGVYNGMLGNFKASVDRIGALFETLIISQLKTSLEAGLTEYRLSFYLTAQGAEVDFILEKDNEVFAIEVKSASEINKVKITGFNSFSSFYGKPIHKYVFYNGKVSKNIDDILIRPWQEGFKEIGI
jgi:predicted AAA+ superfamily ATPase